MIRSGIFFVVMLSLFPCLACKKVKPPVSTTGSISGSEPKVLLSAEDIYRVVMAKSNALGSFTVGIRHEGLDAAGSIIAEGTLSRMQTGVGYRYRFALQAINNRAGSFCVTDEIKIYSELVDEDGAKKAKSGDFRRADGSYLEQQFFPDFSDYVSKRNSKVNVRVLADRQFDGYQCFCIKLESERWSTILLFDKESGLMVLGEDFDESGRLQSRRSMFNLKKDVTFDSLMFEIPEAPE